jgi:hypothetical protein
VWQNYILQTGILRGAWWKKLFSYKACFQGSSYLGCDAASLGTIPDIPKELVHFRVNNHSASNAVTSTDNHNLWLHHHENLKTHKPGFNSNLHLPTVNITKFYKGPYTSGSKAFNRLPWCIKILVNDMKYFKWSLKRFLYHNSFYSTEEHHEHNED